MNAKPKAKEFPVNVRRGSAIVKIYRDRKPSGEYFRVSYYLGGKRIRLNFPDFEAAKRDAEAKAAQLSRGDVDAVQLTGKDRLTYGRALDAVKSFGSPLDAVAIEYAEARKLLPGYSLIEAARFYAKHQGKGIQGQTVSEAVTAFQSAKKAAGRSALYLKDIGCKLKDFQTAFKLEVRQLSPEDIADFLDGQKFKPRNFNNHLLMLRTFFRFCQSQGWLSAEVDLLARVERRKQAATDIEIFTPKELAELLAASPPRVAVCLAIQAFAGVRSAELFRLTWPDIERRNGHIEISAAQAKTASRRLIPISANLQAWLDAAPDAQGRIWPVTESEYYEQLAIAAKAAGVPWKKNAPRHSFISYRLALLPDVAAVSLEAGNSAKMIFAHYRQLCTEAEAKQYFGILPDKGASEKIVRMNLWAS